MPSRSFVVPQPERSHMLLARIAVGIGMAALLAALPGSAWAGGKALAISPATTTAAAGSSVTFKASGGAGGYEFSLTVNDSGGSVDEGTGVYTAGAHAGKDEVTVTDSAGQTKAAQVQVQGSPTAAPVPGSTDLGGHR